MLYQQIINCGPIQHGMVSSHLPLVIRFTTVCENVDCVISDVIVKHCGITFSHIDIFGKPKVCFITVFCIAVV